MELTKGQEVEFTYNGSQDEFSGTRQKGVVVELVPRIKWQGGSVPLDETGYATDVVVKEN